MDIWGFGCIMAELWTRSPIFQGNSEQTQLLLLTQMCGPITPETWPGVQFLSMYNSIKLPNKQIRKVNI